MFDIFMLLRIKNNGGLLTPSSETYQLLHFTESMLRSMVDIYKPLKSVRTLEKRLEINVLTEALSYKFFASLDSQFINYQFVN